MGLLPLVLQRPEPAFSSPVLSRGADLGARVPQLGVRGDEQLAVTIVTAGITSPVVSSTWQALFSGRPIAHGCPDAVLDMQTNSAFLATLNGQAVWSYTPENVMAYGIVGDEQSGDPFLPDTDQRKVSESAVSYGTNEVRSSIMVKEQVLDDIYHFIGDPALRPRTVIRATRPVAQISVLARSYNGPFRIIYEVDGYYWGESYAGLTFHLSPGPAKRMAPFS